jgi:hypothetical protein
VLLEPVSYVFGTAQLRWSPVRSPKFQVNPAPHSSTRKCLCPCVLLCAPCRRVPAQRAGGQQAHIQGPDRARVSAFC